MYFYTLSVFSLPFIPFDCHFYDCSNSISYREIEPGCDIMSTRMKIPTSTSTHSSLCKFKRKEKAMFDYKELETIVGCFCTLLYPLVHILIARMISCFLIMINQQRNILSILLEMLMKSKYSSFIWIVNK